MPNQEAYQLQYVFGYAMDGSDLPCYMLWPTRTVEQSFCFFFARAVRARSSDGHQYILF